MYDLGYNFIQDRVMALGLKFCTASLLVHLIDYGDVSFTM